MKLIKADNIILSQLEYNPRITDKKLGELCHLSKDSIRYRIKRLENKKVIKGYSCFIDFTKLGYQAYKIYLKVTLTEEEKISFKSYLRSFKNTFAFAESKGNWDFAICFFCKSNTEFHEIENKVLSKLEGKLRDKRFCSLFNAKIYSPIEHSNTISMWGEPENNILDNSDKKIIKALFKNSRASLIDLSKQTSLNVDTVRTRMKKLQEKGIIPTLVTLIDHELLGYTHFKLLISLKNHSKDIEDEITAYFKADTNIANYTKAIGSWRFEVEYYVKNYSELETSLSTIQAKFSNYLKDMEYSSYSNEEMFAANELLLE